VRPAQTEALSRANGHQGFGDQTSIDIEHCVGLLAERKSFATLQAGFALEGYELHRRDDGLMLIDRAGMARRLASAEQARQVLAEMGGPR
jgi:hypothetical protein